MHVYQFNYLLIYINDYCVYYLQIEYSLSSLFSMVFQTYFRQFFRIFMAFIDIYLISFLRK